MVSARAQRMVVLVIIMRGFENPAVRWDDDDRMKERQKNIDRLRLSDSRGVPPSRKATTLLPTKTPPSPNPRVP